MEERDGRGWREGKFLPEGRAEFIVMLLCI